MSPIFCRIYAEKIISLFLKAGLFYFLSTTPLEVDKNMAQKIPF
jgi:hypothetical protein